eukprot:scaffold15222_cov173-Skeletonema_marinoi.AAC.4
MTAQLQSRDRFDAYCLTMMAIQSCSCGECGVENQSDLSSLKVWARYAVQCYCGGCWLRLRFL